MHGSAQQDLDLLAPARVAAVVRVVEPDPVELLGHGAKGAPAGNVTLPEIPRLLRRAALRELPRHLGPQQHDQRHVDVLGDRADDLHRRCRQPGESEHAHGGDLVVQPRQDRQEAAQLIWGQSRPPGCGRP